MKVFSRPEAPAVAVLGLASVALLVGSVALAFAQAPSGSVYQARAQLPESLFAVDPQEQVAPVAEVIVSEVAPVPTPAPSLSVSRGTRPARTGVPGPTPEPRLKLGLSFASEVLGKERGQRIVHTAVIVNEGEGELAGIRFTSHVPDGTAWSGKGCADGLKSLTFAVDSDPPRQSCVDPAADGSGHQVKFDLPSTLMPGSSVSIAFEVEVVDEELTRVVDHAHVTGGSLSVSSGDVVTELR